MPFQGNNLLIFIALELKVYIVSFYQEKIFSYWKQGYFEPIRKMIEKCILSKRNVSVQGLFAYIGCYHASRPA